MAVGATGRWGGGGGVRPPKGSASLPEDGRPCRPMGECTKQQSKPGRAVVPAVNELATARPQALGVSIQRHGPGRDAFEGKGPQRRLGRRLEEVAEAVGGGYCRLQMPLKPTLGARETVAGHGLGALEGGGGTSPPSNAPLLPGHPPRRQVPRFPHPHHTPRAGPYVVDQAPAGGVAGLHELLDVGVAAKKGPEESERQGGRRHRPARARSGSGLGGGGA